MRTMIDEIFDRQYQSGRNDFHDGIDRLVKRVGRGAAATFEAIQRVQYDAPWRASKKRRGCA